MRVRILLDEDLLKRISEITMTRYDDKLEDIESMIEDLVYYYHNLEEEFDDYKQMVEDNYKPIPISEQVGISNEDFI